MVLCHPWVFLIFDSWVDFLYKFSAGHIVPFLALSRPRGWGDVFQQRTDPVCTLILVYNQKKNSFILKKSQKKTLHLESHFGFSTFIYYMLCLCFIDPLTIRETRLWRIVKPLNSEKPRIYAVFKDFVLYIQYFYWSYLLCILHKYICIQSRSKK